MTIERLGNKATVDPKAPPPPASARDLAGSHTDTFAAGPPWNDFARATGLDQAAKTADSVYTISVYRAAPGHREQLLKVLNEPLPGEVTAGNVVMQHLEGGPWNYLSISRYNSWLDFAKGESSSVAETRTGKGGWFELRAHAAYHNDTVADRIAP